MTNPRHYEHWPTGMPRSLTIPKTPVHDNLLVTARRFPEKTAIHYYGRDISYREIMYEAGAVAGFLQQQLGVQRGDRVALYLQNSPQYVVSYYGILLADAVVVPVNPMNVTAELSFYFQDSQTKVVFSGQELLHQVLPLAEQGDIQHIVVCAYSEYIGKTSAWEAPEVVKAPRQALPTTDARIHEWATVIRAELKPEHSNATSNDVAVLPYTSGTTGISKGCIHTHASAQANIVGGATWSHLTSDSVVLSTLPLFHVTGMEHSMNVPIYTGATMVLLTRWDRIHAAKAIESRRVTHWKLIATMLVDFLANPAFHQYDLSSLHYLGGGGASVPKAIAEKCKAMTGHDYIEGYGLTETISTSHVNPDHRPKDQCAGIPAFDVDARVWNAETDSEAEIGEQGEIIIAGPQVFQGYWNRPEENEAAFISFEGKSFFRTGDIGYMDGDGYFFIVDRVKRMINAAGFKVWPTEVESILYKHPAVEQACVIGVPDERRGQTVKAFIVLNPNYHVQMTAEDMIAWSRAQMAAYKVPREVQFVKALPMSGSGKVLWRTLQEEANRNMRV